MSPRRIGDLPDSKKNEMISEVKTLVKRYDPEQIAAYITIKYNTSMNSDDVNVLNNIIITNPRSKQDYDALVENLLLWGSRARVGVKLGIFYAQQQMDVLYAATLSMDVLRKI